MTHRGLNSRRTNSMCWIRTSTYFGDGWDWLIHSSSCLTRSGQWPGLTHATILEWREMTRSNIHHQCTTERGCQRDTIVRWTSWSYGSIGTSEDVSPTFARRTDHETKNGEPWPDYHQACLCLKKIVNGCTKHWVFTHCCTLCFVSANYCLAKILLQDSAVIWGQVPACSFFIAQL